MHDTSFAKMGRLLDGYCDRDRHLSIIDIGARVVQGNRSYRELCSSPLWNYRGADLEPAENVDIVLGGTDRWPSLENDCCDVVLSGQMLEHAWRPWEVVREITRILRPGGLAIIIAPSSGPEHRWPHDCWRFYPDGIRSLAETAGLESIEIWTDWGIQPWQDTVGVLQKPAVDGKPPIWPLCANQDICFRWYRETTGPGIRSETYWLHLVRQLRARNEASAIPAIIEEGCRHLPESSALLSLRLNYQLRRKKWMAAMGSISLLFDCHQLSRQIYMGIETALSRMPPEYIELCKQLLRPDSGKGARHRSIAMKLNLPLSCGILGQTSRDDITPALTMATRRRAQGDFAGARQAFNELATQRLSAGIVERTTLINYRIKHQQADSYLEIGVSRGMNLLQIDCRHRVAVDPAFRIPGGTTDELGVSWFAITSDEFFRHHASTALPGGADIILIDGLHTYMQSLRDAENSLLYLAPKGIILMHDCLPQTEAEAAPQQAWARIMDPKSLNWTGDVWKTIAYLRCTRDDLEVFTIDTDHGIGIIRKAKRRSKPRCDADSLASFSFADLMRQKHDLLDLRDAAEAFTLLED
jgi:SAM-dependent methyltransferase